MTKPDTFNHTSGYTISSGDASIYVEPLGESNKPVLLMLHGGFGSIEDFNQITPSLISRFRLIGFDSRGHGRSTLGHGQLSYHSMEQDLEAVIAHHKLDAFSILGFSDGGITALRYAARNNLALRRLVTVGASWEMSDSDPAWPMLTGMTVADWKEAFPATLELYQRLNPEPDFNTFGEAVLKMWTDLSENGYPGSSLGRATVPVMMIRGVDDPLTSTESMDRLSQVLKQVDCLNLEAAGHAAFNDAPQAFMAAINRFL